ncbi:hypothetical protein PENSPDRAFT_84681 [Peniophora sp. CONT]|nr:hypothetical protein PENSPDRAFT_84681 [Peniophora sp. CONT]
MQRAFGALPNERPPPLEKNYAITEFTRALHRKDAPDWSHPEIIWGDLQSLDLSTPLNVPPSIIFWSIVHQLPVYMHPDYRVMSRQGPFAHPYACSEYVFSDESAAEYRAELGFPPLENAQPLRPMKALEVMEGRTITDEGYIAERVALLESNGELPLSPPTESLAPATSHESEELPLPAPTSSKRPRVSDVDLPPDGALALVGHSSRSTSPSSPLGSDSSARRRRAPVPDVHTRPSGTAADDVVTSNPTSDVTPRDPTPARAPKRPKTSHSPTPSPVACSAPTAGPEKVKHTLRSSPEVLSPAHESRAPATLSESPGAVTTTEPELKRSDAEAVEATDIGPGSPPSHSPAASPRS